MISETRQSHSKTTKMRLVDLEKSILTKMSRLQLLEEMLIEFQLTAMMLENILRVLRHKMEK